MLASTFSIHVPAEWKEKIRKEYERIKTDNKSGVDKVPPLLEGAMNDVLKQLEKEYLVEFIGELERQVMAHVLPPEHSSGGRASISRPLHSPTVDPNIVGDKKIVVIIGGGFCGSTVA